MFFFQNTEAEDDDSIEKQVRVDLLRTLPTHTDFKSLESDGVRICCYDFNSCIVNNENNI